MRVWVRVRVGEGVVGGWVRVRVGGWVRVRVGGWVRVRVGGWVGEGEDED